jgi:hypothetical protein
LFTLNRQKQITKTELEFNSVAWGQDTFQLPCGSADGAPPAEDAEEPTNDDGENTDEGTQTGDDTMTEEGTTTGDEETNDELGSL